MAIDTALLDRAEAGECWLRLYAWLPCLSFGRHEPVERRYDAEAIAARGLATVRRPTGGRAVWHDAELTYAVALPADVLGGLRQTYQAIHAMLRDAIRGFGIEAELAERRRATPVDAGACFAAAAGGEVMVHGRKLVGSAQVRRGTALLQHGSVLLDGDQGVVGAVTRGSAEPDRSMALARAAGRRVAWSEVASAIHVEAGQRWVVAPATDADVAGILATAAGYTERYRAEAWTWSVPAPPDAVPLPC